MDFYSAWREEIIWFHSDRWWCYFNAAWCYPIIFQDALLGAEDNEKYATKKKKKIGGRGDSDEDKLHMVVVVVMVVMMMSLVVVVVVTVMVNGCVLMMMPERASARSRSDAGLKKKIKFIFNYFLNKFIFKNPEAICTLHR